MPVTIHHQIQSHPAAVVRDHRVEARRVERRPVVVERGRDWNRIHPIIVRPQPIVVAPTYATTWTPAASYTYQPGFELLAPTALASDQLAISTPSSLGSATSLELDAYGSGSTYVSQLIVYRADGSSQAIPVGQLLTASNPTVRLPIDNCGGISQIVIDGHSEWGSQLAMRAI